MSDRSVPNGWTTWHAQPDGMIVLTYRPDIFDGSTYAADWLPTITIKPARSRGPRGRPQSPNAADAWVAELTLLPGVTVERHQEARRAAAIDAGFALAEAFVAGEFDPREAGTDLPEEYVRRLAELISQQ